MTSEANRPEPAGASSPGGDEVLHPGLVEAQCGPLERLHAEALHWEGEASRAREWLAYTRAALAEARAQRHELVWGGDRPAGDLGPLLGELSARVEQLERTEAVQAVHAAEVVPRAEAAAAALADAIRRRDEGVA